MTKMKHKVVIFAIVFILSLISAQAVEIGDSVTASTADLNNVQELPADAPPFNELDENSLNEEGGSQPETLENTLPDNAVIPHKQPIGKRRLIVMFLKAAFGVVVSSLIIYVILSVYNRIRGYDTNNNNAPGGETTLNVPNDYEDAVKIFLEKTKWN